MACVQLQLFGFWLETTTRKPEMTTLIILGQNRPRIREEKERWRCSPKGTSPPAIARAKSSLENDLGPELDVAWVAYTPVPHPKG
jgi:hypothetical protein